MKKIFTSLLFIFLVHCTHAQNYTYVDSLKKAFSLKPEEKTLMSLTNFYTEVNNDTCRLYAQQLYELAIKSNSKSYQGWGLTYLGIVMTKRGNTAQDLELCNKALQLFKEANDSCGISIIYFRLGILYNVGNNDSTRVLGYLLKSLHMAPVYPAKSNPDYPYWESDFCKSFALWKLSDFYFQINKPDSALIYANQFLLVEQRLPEKRFKNAVLRSIGNYYERSGNNTLAMQYFRRAVAEANAYDNFTTVAYIYLSFADIFDKNSQSDSAYYYAKHAMLISQNLKDYPLIDKSSSFLNDFFKKKNKVDSAYKY